MACRKGGCAIFGTKTIASGWRGVCLVAITYVYFLIFAQFAFLRRLTELGIADTHLKIVMAAMAAGGILFSLLSARPAFALGPRLRLRIALCVCGATALLALLALNLAGSIAVSFLIGAGLGTLTVTLVSNLSLWVGSSDGLLKVGVGTGLGYLICNFPPLFTAAGSVQSITAAGLCLLGIFVAATSTTEIPVKPVSPLHTAIPFGLVLVCFTALVWLDSAAFFIIQNSPSLKAGTWDGTLHLWITGLLHFSAAIASALLLRRRGLSFVLCTAVLALACACLLLLDPGRALLASVFYPVGVSLYSVALVAYPSLLAPAESPQDRARLAGLTYAVAGWFGSAMGIGMGQHLGQVPVGFVILAVILVLGPHLLKLFRSHRREAGTIAASVAAAFCIHRAILAASGSQPGLSAIERGRKVYIAEGCINCHSQYVRPNTPDVLMWGPTETVEELHSQRPPLIGNRRQGPDLSQVGGRRSTLWLKAHFYDPRQVSHASFMPLYAYLFRGSTRGDDLLSYLGSLKSSDYPKHIQIEQAWQPSSESVSAARLDAGAHLFNAYCATCHEREGATRLAWLTSFKRLPPDLQTGPWLHLPASDTSQERELRLAQIVKFGVPGTDMPGYEYLSDEDVSSIALWLNRSMVQPAKVASTHYTQGANQ